MKFKYCHLDKKWDKKRILLFNPKRIFIYFYKDIDNIYEELREFNSNIGEIACTDKDNLYKVDEYDLDLHEKSKRIQLGLYDGIIIMRGLKFRKINS